MKTTERNIGWNKGRPRIWLEKAVLTESGFEAGDRIDITSEPDRMVITRNPDGKRKVSGAPGRPIIDLSGKTVESAFDTDKVERVSIRKLRDGMIELTPAQ